jgi:aminobenzoyl-glutamate utilization protein A
MDAPRTPPWRRTSRGQARGGVATYLAIGSDLAGPHHTLGFDVDEAVLGPGVDLLERAVRALVAG